MLPQSNTPRKVPRKQRKLPARAVHLKHRPVNIIAYMCVDNALIDEYWRLIGLGEKAVLIAVMRLIDKTKQPAAEIKVREIVDYAGLSPNSVRTALDDLTARGVLVVVAPATRNSGASYSVAYPEITKTYSVAYPQISIGAQHPPGMTHEEVITAITESVSGNAQPIATRHERKQRGQAITGNSAPTAPDAPKEVRHRFALMSAPEYRPLYDAVQETVFTHNTEIPESRIGKVTRALMELQPPCTPEELLNCAAWYSAAHNSPLPCDKDCAPLIAAAMQDYRAAGIASETECAHDAA